MIQPGRLCHGGNANRRKFSRLLLRACAITASLKTVRAQQAYQQDDIDRGADNTTLKMESTPLVVDGIMYVTEPPNNIVALDAKTGAVFWMYQYTEGPELRTSCGSPNRGLAILGNTLFMGTLDAHLVAVDAKSGTLLWDTKVASPQDGASITEVPLI